jgi:hypothetical protein
MMPALMIVVRLAVITVSPAFRLEAAPYPYKIRSEAMEHIFDHMVGPNAKNLTSNFGRQMSISQMPRKAHKLMGVLMPDFDNRFCGGLNR